jgi:hypothetical protein
MDLDSIQPMYYLIYSANQDSICVLRLYDSESHELGDYLRASRQSWRVAKEATAYGMALAEKNNIRFEHDRDIDNESYQESMLLD